MRVAVRIEQSVRGGSTKALPAVRVLRWFVTARGRLGPYPARSKYRPVTTANNGKRNTRRRRERSKKRQ